VLPAPLRIANWVGLAFLALTLASGTSDGVTHLEGLIAGMVAIVATLASSALPDTRVVRCVVIVLNALPLLLWIFLLRLAFDMLKGFGPSLILLTMATAFVFLTVIFGFNVGYSFRGLLRLRSSAQAS
jgi:hypothetical protein